MTAQSLLNKIIGKAPWSVWKGIGSFLLFEFGRKTRPRTSGRLKGTYTLWITMAHWYLRQSGKEVAHSESPDKVIEGAAKLLKNKMLKAVELRTFVLPGKTRQAVSFHFADKLILQAFMYEHRDLNNRVRKPDTELFMVLSPTHVVAFDYAGNLSIKKIQTTRIKIRADALRPKKQSR